MNFTNDELHQIIYLIEDKIRMINSDLKHSDLYEMDDDEKEFLEWYEITLLTLLDKITIEES